MNTTNTNTDVSTQPAWTIDKDQVRISDAINVFDGDRFVGSYALNATIIRPANASPSGVMWLFHGFGAPGSDLVPLGEIFASKLGLEVVCLEAPLDVPGTGGGRSWWPIDMLTLMSLRDRGEYVKAVGILGANAPKLASTIVQTIVSHPLNVAKDVPVIFAGFSQGAMLAAEIAWLLSGQVQVAGRQKSRAADGLLVFSSAPHPGRDFGSVKYPIFYSYGVSDPYLQGNVTTNAIKQFGGQDNPNLSMFAFSGGHEIPHESIRRALDVVEKILKSSTEE